MIGFMTLIHTYFRLLMKQNDHCMMPFVLFVTWFVTIVSFMVVVLLKSVVHWQLPRLPMKYVFPYSYYNTMSDMLLYIDLFH